MKNESLDLKSKTNVLQPRIEPYFAHLSSSTQIVVTAVIGGEKKKPIDKIRLGTLCPNQQE